MKFLFINDNEGLLRSICTALGGSPANVIFSVCHSVRDAIRAISENWPDAIFLDHQLSPQGNEGLEVVERTHGIKFYSTTTNENVVGEYEKRGIQNVGRLDLAELRAIIAVHIEEEERRLPRAIEILGSAKVLTALQAGSLWSRIGYERDVPYSEKTLLECRQQNISGESDWRLLYQFPLSLREQYELRGIRGDPFGFQSEWGWYSRHETWALRKVRDWQEGYRLLDMKGSRETTWERSASHETIVSQAIMGFAHSQGEVLLADWHHCGSRLKINNYDCCVIVGYSKEGIVVDTGAELSRDSRSCLWIRPEISHGVDWTGLQM